MDVYLLIEHVIDTQKAILKEIHDIKCNIVNLGNKMDDIIIGSNLTSSNISPRNLPKSPRNSIQTRKMSENFFIPIKGL